jgi:protein tyrosine/serine phosphatase
VTTPPGHDGGVGGPDAGTGEQRLHRLEGVYNLRDLGGLPTEDGRTTVPGRVFRSDSLQSVSARDVALLHDTLGVRSLIDLRGEDEVLAEGRGALVERGVRYTNLPLVQEDGSLVSYLEDSRTVDLVPRYLSYLDSPGRTMLRALELISDAETAPTVFFCAAGKDRTGVLSALVLRLVGVQPEAVINDYLLSAESAETILRERLMPSPTYAHHIATLPREVYTAEAETMRRFLAALDDEHGGAERWARDQGLPQQVVDRLRAALLPPGPSVRRP